MSKPLRFAALSILALVVIVISAIWLMRLTPLANSRLDLTEDKIHTLSDGTREVLKNLDAPVILRYYASRNSEGVPRDFELYMRKVDDFIAEYKAIAGDELIIQNIDPEPDTDEEDSAILDGVNGQRLNEYDNFFFGISVSCLDKKKSLPFLNPEDETLLEYNLTSAIAEVSASQRPVIGLMSAFQLSGGISSPTMPGQQPRQAQPWVIYEELKNRFELEDLTLNPESIPDHITTVLLVHPAGIQPRTEFLLDQFVLRGGKLIAMVDPMSIVAQGQSGQAAAFGGGIPTASDLPTLFSHWGLNYTADKVIADSKYKREVQGGRTAVALLGLDGDAFPQKDELLTRDLNDLLLVLAGGIRHEATDGPSYTPLVISSGNAYQVDPQKAATVDPSLIGLPGEGEPYDFIARLQGSFTTAFPDGDPTAEKKADASEDETTESDEASAANEEDNENLPALTESTSDGAVFIITDTDWIFDDFAFRRSNILGQTIVQAQGGSAALFLNIIDQATGSTALVGARSRASSRRPFTRIEEMRAEAEESVSVKVREIQTRQAEAEARINELQAQKSGADKLFLSPEQEEEIRNFREQNVAYNKQIRELRKDLKKETDALEGRLFKYNVFLMPLLVAVFGFTFLKMRSRKTGAA